MKKNLCLREVLTAAVLMLIGATPLSAQMFEASSPVQPTVTSQQAPREQRFNNSWANPRQAKTSAGSAASSNVTQPVQQPKTNVNKTEAVSAQQARQNAADELKRSLAGKRGTGAIRRVFERGEQPVEEESLIFLFYKDFKVSQTMSGLVMCDVKFIILHTMADKLNNLSFRLKWPGMQTSLSFNDVMPNVETYFNYTLVGDGCYTMDKIPNVIVNRCRAKGLTQKNCANKIRWLKK